MGESLDHLQRIGCGVFVNLHEGWDPRLAECLSGPPWDFGGRNYWPVEFLDTGKRDAIRDDLLTPVTEMEFLAWASL